jgi:hypothetical protein
MYGHLLTGGPGELVGEACKQCNLGGALVQAGVTICSVQVTIIEATNGVW